MFTGVAVMHFFYVFLYETDLFTVIFCLVGIAMLTCQYLGRRSLLAIASCLSCIAVSVQLACLLLSHFEAPRDLITRLVPRSVLDISVVYEPSGMIVLLSILLWLSTVALGSRAMEGEWGFVVKESLYEIRVLLDKFYFYLCWIFIFTFSVVNDNPSIIKFLLMLFFAFGRWSKPIFDKIRIPFLIFNVAYLALQLVAHIAPWDDPDKSYYPYLKYIGLFFSGGGKPTKAERNMSLVWQLVVVFLGVVNSKFYEQHVTPVKFELMGPVQIYNALAALLHHLLPILIQISLCTSTLFNPSIFGWFSYVVMVIVNYQPHILHSSSGVITFIFNICFIAQYLLYLGWPTAFVGHFWSSVDSVPDDNKARVIDWLRFLGIYDVTTSALVSNCISAYIFTFYLTWHNEPVDYEKRFRDLKVILKAIIRWYTTYVFEIMMVLNMAVNSMIDTFDGLCFFILTGTLLVVSLFHGYSKEKTLQVMSLGTFGVIAMRALSRMPVFVESGIGRYVREAFDVPFKGDSNFEMLWVVVYGLERVSIHILQCNLYLECDDGHQRHLSYRFIRARQLRVLVRLDQELAVSRAPRPEDVGPALTKVIGVRQTIGYEGDESIFQKIRNHVWFPLFDQFIRLVGGTLSLNQEAGINVLTLQSLHRITKKLLREGSRERSEAEPKEITFIRRLHRHFSGSCNRCRILLGRQLCGAVASHSAFAIS
jgi:hypothetical protein